MVFEEVPNSLCSFPIFTYLYPITRDHYGIQVWRVVHGSYAPWSDNGGHYNWDPDKPRTQKS
jgi:hypothetical protein